jgi:phosphatidylserine/phosphatidylglycerophosphate/cardiolipin synthase-like enzyme
MRRPHLWILLAGLILLVAACGFLPTSVATEPSAVPTKPATASDTTALNWIRVYFTDPNPPDNVGQGIDNYVVPVLDAAQKSIDVASFDFNLPSVTNALVDAKKRGVVVRAVLDRKNGTQVLRASDSPDSQELDAVKALQDANIPVVDGGRSNGLMHNKMIIVDGTTLFMGSWNMSYNDTFRNDNNLLQITSQKLIANYQAKFNEMFLDKKFGTKAVVGARTPKLTINGVAVENYFSPVDHVTDKLAAYVKGAKKSIKFMVFTYTDKDLSSAMIAQAKAGLEVQGVIENRGASQGAFVPLYCAGLSVEVDGNKYTMHHKVIILDDETVITGSFNLTQTADEANDDNVLVIHSLSIAAQYDQEFAQVYGQGKEPETPPDCSK